MLQIYKLLILRCAPDFAEDDFGREVLRGPAECPCPAFDLLAEPEVSHLHISPVVYQQVFWLQVPVDQVQVV